MGEPEPERPRIFVVDGSRVVRRMIAGILARELRDPEVVGCTTGAEALEALESGQADLMTTALRLPDMDGLELTRRARDSGSQRYFPIIVVSGDVTERLHREGQIAEVTDYFDKSHGFEALGAFIRGYVNPEATVTGHVLFVEDSRVVAMATERMLGRAGMAVTHLNNIEEALERLENSAGGPGSVCDVVLSDVYLRGGMTGHDLLRRLRRDLGVGRRELPVLVITGESDPRHHAELLRLGANDLVEKPIREPLLVAKLRFQLHLRGQQPAGTQV